ncbi:unnamed protein product [Bursaphelenchus xylophilus]|uniref:(pine wood nematode) hypothetical protein n=1 Tax=Bursaphelenchus xylophilus TaxID=6326 RepID=A0A1I7S4P7_BURXY|nr:unnamed protein product [Bursaphelenchus xylophilus]CAG9117281.1 unnamed protein product [Bursaphelenchus xylophilus]
MSSPESCSSNDYLTIDFSGDDKAKVCQVCGATPAGNHFDVVSCRPCSAFFRRTVVLKRNFTCKLKGNCPINKNIRSICSHCRFKKCVSLGMSKHNINANYDKATPKESSRNSTISLKISATPLIDQMLEGYKKFDDDSKKLFFVCNPEELFSGDKVFKPGTVFEYMVFNRSQNVYIWEMATNHYPPFKDIVDKDRTTIFQSFGFRFTKLRTFALNTQYFPDNHDRLVTHYGRYVDKHNQEEFFRTEIDPKQSMRILMPIQIHMFQLASKFRTLKVDEFEVVALSGLLLWKEANWYYQDSRYSFLIDQLLSELTYHAKKNHGETKGQVRVGQLCCILRDIEELALTMLEARFLGMFLSNYGVPRLGALEKYKKEVT